jgi:hemerythrin-like domain-containing protein
MPAMEALDQTHAQMLVVLDNLARLMDHLERDGVDTAARDSARTICAFFNDHARQHHADEERQIFPKLLESGDAELVQHVQRLQQDHGWLEEDWIELSPQLQAVSEGYSWYDLDTLRAAVGIFADLYHDHIGLEESLIYPQARRQAAAQAKT